MMKKQSKQILALAVACGFLWGNSLSSEAAEVTSPDKQESTVTENTANPDKKVDSVDKTSKKATTDTTKDSKNQVKVPVTITADELYMNDSTGDVYAKGNIKLVQGNQQLLTDDLLNGNTKQQELWIKGQADYTDIFLKVHLDGIDTRYNYQTKEGTMESVKGKAGQDIISGESVVMEPTEILLRNGTVTRCPAKVPDYHMSAERIEIWPGQKLVAYNAKFWIRDFVIYSLPVFEQSLAKGAQNSAYPSFGYGSTNGVWIKQKIEVPVERNLYAFVNAKYYSKGGFRPDGGFSYHQPDYSLSVIDGNYQDDDDNWVTKKPEFDFDFHSHRIGSTPISYTFNAKYGQWSDSSKASWHQEYELYFTHDAIHLDDKTALNLGTGVGYIHESYDDSHINEFKFNATVTHTFNDRFSTWVGYYHTATQNTLFDFDRADMDNELYNGFSYKIDNKNTFQFTQSYDLDKGHIYDQDYTWIHDIHCWVGSLTYRARRSEWKYDISLKRW